MNTTKYTSIYARVILAGILSMLSVTGTLVRADEPPKLVLQITVDALRGDLPSRYSGMLGDGGFRYLMDQGIHYTDWLYI